MEWRSIHSCILGLLAEQYNDTLKIQTMKQERVINMLVKFLELGDSRLDEALDFEVQTITKTVKLQT